MQSSVVLVFFPVPGAIVGFIFVPGKQAFNSQVNGFVTLLSSYSWLHLEFYLIMAALVDTTVIYLKDFYATPLSGQGPQGSEYNNNKTFELFKIIK